MVAYSFQKQFAPRILDGTKRQTVRARGKRRHAQPGEALQLYTGMRTRHCRLIARATCWRVQPIAIRFLDGAFDRSMIIIDGAPVLREAFAKADGFDSWAELRAFWAKHHAGVDEFEGYCISWHPLEG